MFFYYGWKYYILRVRDLSELIEENRIKGGLWIVHWVLQRELPSLYSGEATIRLNLNSFVQFDMNFQNDILL